MDKLTFGDYRVSIFLIALFFVFMLVNVFLEQRRLKRDFKLLEKVEKITDPSTLQKIYVLGQKYDFKMIYNFLELKGLLNEEQIISQNNKDESD